MFQCTFFLVPMKINKCTTNANDYFSKMTNNTMYTVQQLHTFS